MKVEKHYKDMGVIRTSFVMNFLPRYEIKLAVHVFNSNDDKDHTVYVGALMLETGEWFRDEASFSTVEDAMKSVSDRASQLIKDNFPSPEGSTGKGATQDEVDKWIGAKK